MHTFFDNVNFFFGCGVSLKSSLICFSDIIFLHDFTFFILLPGLSSILVILLNPTFPFYFLGSLEFNSFRAFGHLIGLIKSTSPISNLKASNVISNPLSI